MRYFTIELPTEDQLQALVERVRAAGVPLEQVDAGWLVRDPSQIGLVLTIRRTSPAA
jgi:hypothetical protein